MKRIAIMLVILSIMAIAKGQRPYQRDSVIILDGMSSEDIYDRANKWVMTNYELDSKSIVSINDDKRKLITGNSAIKFEVKNLSWYPMSGHIMTRFEIAAREGRMKVMFTDFVHNSTTPDQVTGTWDEGLLYEEIPEERTKGLAGKQHKEVYKRAIPRINEWFEGQIKSLTTFMQNGTVEDDDW